MKKLIAFSAFFIGLLKIIDWFVFWHTHEAIATSDFLQLKKMYIAHFPLFLQGAFNSRPEIATLICILLFAISGLILIREKKLFFRIVGYISFVLLAWNLFSLM